MILVADENIDRSIVERLRGEGHKLFYVAEMDPGISDDEVLGIADHNNALLLRDRSTITTHFGTPIHPARLRCEKGCIQ